MVCFYNRLKVQMLNLPFKIMLSMQFIYIFITLSKNMCICCESCKNLSNAKYLLAQNCVFLCCFFDKVII